MTSHPDKLFRDGLGAYQKKAPSTAWDRIESGLDRKRTLSPWLKIAAGLLILIATSIVILLSTKNNKQLAIGKMQGESSNQLPITSQEQKNNMQDAITSPLGVGGKNATGKMQNPKSNHLPSRGWGQNGNKQELVYRQLPGGSKSGQLAVGSRPSVGSDQILNNNFTSGLDKEVIASQENADPMKSIPVTLVEDEITDEMSAPVAQAQSERANLSYTVNEVNARFLKKECPADATSEKKNASGIQKVVAVALNIRYEESLVGELREKKNEWLSINTSPKKRELNK